MGTKFSFGGDQKALKLDTGYGCRTEYTKNHCTVHFKKGAFYSM